MEKEIVARFVFEVLGRPPEHIKETLNTLILKVSSEEKAEIIEKTIHDARKVEKGKDMYTAFAEAEFAFSSLDQFFGVLFKYFPAHVELISPGKLQLRSDDINQLGNAILGRLHQYDAVSKKLLAEREVIYNKLKEKDLLKVFQEEDPRAKTDKKKPKKGSKAKKKA